MDGRPPPLNMKILQALWDHGPMTPEMISEKVPSKHGARSIYASLSGMGPASGHRHYVDTDVRWGRGAPFKLSEEGYKLVKFGKLEQTVLSPSILSAKNLMDAARKAFALAEHNLDNVVEACVREINPEIGDVSYTMAHGCTGPLGLCVYDLDEDPSEDDCVFCHLPRERK